MAAVSWIYLVDESNLAPNAHVRFYVCGAMALPIDRLPALNEAVRGIRSDCGYAPEDSLKWQTAGRPAHVSVNQHREAKNRVLELPSDLHLRFFPVLTHHRVALRRSVQDRVEFAANFAVGLVERFLGEQQADAIGLFDRRPAGDEGTYLRSLFQRQPDNPPGRDFSLKRTTALGYTVDGASHLASVLDITLGAFCYCVNEGDPEHLTVPRRLWPKVLERMWWTESAPGHRTLRPEGFAFLPVRIRTQAVLDERSAAIDHLNELLPG